MSVLSAILIGLISLTGFAVGVFCAARPEAAIILQQRFYFLINWKMEPVSLPKEIRNTRVMGIFLCVFCLATLAICTAKALGFL